MGKPDTSNHPKLCFLEVVYVVSVFLGRFKLEWGEVKEKGGGELLCGFKLFEPKYWLGNWKNVEMLKHNYDCLSRVSGEFG